MFPFARAFSGLHMIPSTIRKNVFLHIGSLREKYLTAVSVHDQGLEGSRDVTCQRFCG